MEEREIEETEELKDYSFRVVAECNVIGDFEIAQGFHGSDTHPASLSLDSPAFTVGVGSIRQQGTHVGTAQEALHKRIENNEFDGVELTEFDFEEPVDPCRAIPRYQPTEVKDITILRVVSCRPVEL